MHHAIQECSKRVERIYNEFDASHDFDHILRVMTNAEKIMATEVQVNEHVVRLAVLLHDIEDAKYQNDLNPSVATILKESGVNENLAVEVISCIESVSFSGGNAKDITSLEGAIVRDADRLDAIGAIGIARAFAYGGAKGRKLYDTKEEARMDMTETEYRSTQTSSVTHFYEKLLLLKELMVTSGGKRMATERHAFMESFLQQLSKEIG